MTKIHAPMTKVLMVNYGIKRWIMIHYSAPKPKLMSQLFDSQMVIWLTTTALARLCLRASKITNYKRTKQDPWYKENLFGDHENFADTKRSS